MRELIEITVAESSLHDSVETYCTQRVPSLRIYPSRRSLFCLTPCGAMVVGTAPFRTITEVVNNLERTAGSESK